MTATRMTPDTLEMLESLLTCPLPERYAPLYLACQEVRACWAERDALTAEVERLKQFLDAEVMPRYVELFEDAFPNDQSVLVEQAKALLAEKAQLAESCAQ